MLGQPGMRARFEEVMDDDFNTREAISAIFELVRDINRAVENGADKDSVEMGVGTLEELADILGLFPKTEGEPEVIERLTALLVEVRERARESKDFETADWIREELGKLGIALEDTAKGVVKKAR